MENFYQSGDSGEQDKMKLPGSLLSQVLAKADTKKDNYRYIRFSFTFATHFQLVAAV